MSGRRARRESPDPTTRRMAAGLGVARMAIGAGALLATGPALRLLGFDPAGGETRALARLAGGRDVALGALALLAVDDASELRAVTLANAGVDAADAATFLTALAAHEGAERAALLGAPSALLASATGFWLAKRLERG
jgi:hypothetical protein